MSFAEIARRLDVSAGMVRERYHRLVQEEILQVVAVTNPVRVGYEIMTLIGIKVRKPTARDRPTDPAYPAALRESLWQPDVLCRQAR